MAKRSAKRKKRRKPKRLGRLRLLVAVCALAALLWFVVIPAALATSIQAAGGKALGGELQLSRLTGFLGRKITVSGIRFRLPGARWDLIAGGEAEMRLRRPLWRGNLEIEEIVLRNFHIQLGDRSLETPAPPPPPKAKTKGGGEAAPEASQPKVSWPERLCLENATISLDAGLPDGRLVLIERLNALLIPKPGELVLESLEGRLLGGRLRGSAEYETPTHRWRAQLRLAEGQLVQIVEGTPLAGGITSGDLNAFMELRDPRMGPGIVGAGWLSLGRARLWELPLFNAVLDSLSLAAGEGDLVECARLRCRIDHGRVWFDDLRALGSPVSLYGHGSMDLDGSALAADFVPRIGRHGLLQNLPVVGPPSQLLLDITKGLAVEVQLRGSLRDPEVSTLPLPVITRPIQEFFDLVADL